MIEDNNLFLYNLKTAIKEFTNFITTNKIVPYGKDNIFCQEMLFFHSNYNFLNYAINVIYSQEFFKKGAFNLQLFIKKYEFSWIKDQEKLNTTYFIFMNLLKIIEGNVFYAKFCEKILKYPSNQLSLTLLKNNRNLKMLETYELAQLLMMLVYEPMVNYVKLQFNHLKIMFINYDSEKLKQIFYDLGYYSQKIIAVICANKPQQYISNLVNNIYIKVSDIRISDYHLKDLYLGLRTNILLIFPKQKDVTFNINNQSPLANAMFSDDDINFKDFIKLIIKSKNWSEFIKNVKAKNSKYMTLKYWSNKIMSNIGNMILMNLNKEDNYQ